MAVPVTTAHFHARVLTLLSDVLALQRDISLQGGSVCEDSHIIHPPKVPPLSPPDSNLSPDDSTNQVLAMTSSWIDLCSPDPLITDLSRQILIMEISYAAFCGATYIIVPSPKLDDGYDSLNKYARALQEALDVGPYLQIIAWFSMSGVSHNREEDVGDLAAFAREDFVKTTMKASMPEQDVFETWDAWNSIRSVCKYHSRLFVGEIAVPFQ